MTVLFCFVFPLCLLLLFPLAYLETGGRWKGLLPVTLCAFLVAYGWFAFFAQRGGLRFVDESFMAVRHQRALLCGILCVSRRWKQALSASL
jgi:hypothetical protein